MLNEYLKQLGFSDKEIAVYLCVLENGKIAATAVSEITKINRTTVYSVAKELIKKAVISEDFGGTSRYYTSLPPDELNNFYKTQEEELKQKKIAIDKIIPELENLPKSKQYSVPKIRFIDEVHLRDFLFKQLPVWINSAKTGDKNWWGFQDASLIDAYPDWFDYHYQIYPENFGTYLITNKKPAEKEFAKKMKSDDRRQIKYWAKTNDFTATHAVLGNYVLFIVTKQHPYYMVETHDAVMAQNLRELFKGFWDKI